MLDVYYGLFLLLFEGERLGHIFGVAFDSGNLCG
ncbi:hypothetical protein J2W56_006267 [Nocardia kruczakiae]|uniref:Uncharacterized protein n=1 Tax=Nocardia kruczakiae TaxID=261477 RepID=A0ABU1XRK2_9NOCA|nr:hypothetical protein [Nocardia kruczakiae]